MFTGIISHLGKVRTKSKNNLQVACSKDLIDRLSKGASIAVDGICLTVVSLSKDSFGLDFMPETATRTNIKYLKINNLVNLELSATPNTSLAGHIVQGHVDGLGIIKKIKKEGNSRLLTIEYPERLDKYIVGKGSISINGISLTVINVQKYCFTVGIAPYTWKHTMLQYAKIGDLVNIEVDIIAKYLEKLLKERSI